MAQDNWRIIAESVMQNVNICPTNTTVINFNLYLVITTNRFVNFQKCDIPLSGRVFH